MVVFYTNSIFHLIHSKDIDLFPRGKWTILSSEVKYLNGDIAEVIVYNAVVPAAQRASLRRYLGQLYGITVV